MNSSLRLYALSKVSSLSEAATYGGVGLHAGVLGGAALGYASPESAKARAGLKAERAANAAALAAGPTDDRLLQKGLAMTFDKNAPGALTDKMVDALYNPASSQVDLRRVDRLLDTNNAAQAYRRVYGQMGRYGAAGALGLGALGAGVGLFS